ncbi:MAG: class I SAM-dependent RNA methyltransferase, partial [Myxococcota bacterium]
MPEAELRIERLSMLGEGVAHLDGRTVFVEGALPGERVCAEVSEHGKVLRGELLDILEQSPARRAPACPLAASCGGCDWLHADERLQREAKEEIVLSALEHLAGISRQRVERLPTVVSPRSMAYRRRAVLHVQGKTLGFFGKKSHAHVDVPACPALTEPLSMLPGRLGPLVAAMAKDLESVTLIAEGTQVSLALHLSGPVKARHLELTESAVRALKLSGAVLVPKTASPRLVKSPVLRSTSPLSPKVPMYSRPDAFVQANAEANVALVTSAVVALGAKEHDRVLELYCGQGNFTFAIAGTAASVLAVESSGVSLELARRSAQEGRVDNVRFVQGEAAKVVKGLFAEGARFDLLLADPPRAGAPGLSHWARMLGARRVVYVACDPAALARDARELRVAGFRPHTLQIV